jgi:hypothetical protein
VLSKKVTYLLGMSFEVHEVSLGPSQLQEKLKRNFKCHSLKYYCFLEEPCNCFTISLNKVARQLIEHARIRVPKEMLVLR